MLDCVTLCRRAVKIMKKRRLSRIANGEENVRRYSTGREREREREGERERKREKRINFCENIHDSFTFSSFLPLLLER